MNDSGMPLSPAKKGVVFATLICANLCAWQMLVIFDNKTQALGVVVAWLFFPTANVCYGLLAKTEWKALTSFVYASLMVVGFARHGFIGLTDFERRSVYMDSPGSAIIVVINMFVVWILILGAGLVAEAVWGVVAGRMRRTEDKS